MAHALHNMLEDVCGKEGILCPAMTPLPSGVDLLKHIRNVSFTSKKPFKFQSVEQSKKTCFMQLLRRFP